MDPYVEEQLDWRPITESDLDALHALQEQIESVDDTVYGPMERVVHQTDTSQVEQNSIGGWDAYGNLIAYGWNVGRLEDVAKVHLLGGVHPANRYKGIGRSLLRWQMAAAEEWRREHHAEAELWLGCYVDDGQPSLARLLKKFEFEQERYYYDFHRRLTHLPAERQVQGIDLVPYDHSYCEPLRQLHNRCFQSSQDGEVDSLQWHQLLSHDRFRPSWSWVAIQNGTPVGYALSRLDDVQEPDRMPSGWTDRVGVAPEFQGRGISLSLLAKTLSSMAEGGCLWAGIGVDTADPTSTEKLSQELGYEPSDGLVLMSKVVPKPVR